MPVVPMRPVQVGRARRVVTERAASSSYAWTFYVGSEATLVRDCCWRTEVGWDKGYFFDLVLVSLIGTGPVIGKGLGAGEFVVGGGGRHDVAVARYLAGEAGDRSGY